MNKLKLIACLVVIAFVINACNTAVGLETNNLTQPIATQEPASDQVAPVALDKTYTKRDGVEVIYLAGGCFWGVEKLIGVVPKKWTLAKSQNSYT